MMQPAKGMQRRALAAAAMALLASGTLCRSVAAQPLLPQNVLQLLPQARLRGSGTLRFWGAAVYQAQLYTLHDFLPDSYHAQPFALELHYLRAIKGEAIAQHALEEMRRLDQLTGAETQTWLQRMQAAFPDVAAGDRLTGIYLPGKDYASRFFANGKFTGELVSRRFARLFFGIWLDPKTPQPALRAQLLGLAQ